MSACEPMPVPEAAVGQMDGAAFWVVDRGRGREYWPIDRHAVYCGFHRDGLPEGVTIRMQYAGLLQAIRTLGARQTFKSHPGDRVRVNGGSWMEVVPYDEFSSFADEGFVCRYENGDVLYGIEPYPGSRDWRLSGPWMRRWDDHSSEGEVDYIEVVWGDYE